MTESQKINARFKSVFQLQIYLQMFISVDEDNNLCVEKLNFYPEA